MRKRSHTRHHVGSKTQTTVEYVAGWDFCQKKKKKKIHLFLLGFSVPPLSGAQKKEREVSTYVYQVYKGDFGAAG